MQLVDENTRVNKINLSSLPKDIDFNKKAKMVEQERPNIIIHNTDANKRDYKANKWL